MTAPPLKGRKLTCASKKRHPDEVTARASAMRSIEMHHDSVLLYVYRCPECHGWHLTKRRQGSAISVGNPVVPRIPTFTNTPEGFENVD